MPFTTPKMGLQVWDGQNDPYDHEQLANNFNKLDLHDHTPGRGVQIPTEGIFDGAITTAKLSAEIASGLSTWTSFRSNVPNATNIFYGIPTSGTANTNTAADQVAWTLTPSDYAINGQLHFRMRSSVYTAAASPWNGGAIQVGYVPIDIPSGTNGSFVPCVTLNPPSTAVTAVTSQVGAPFVIPYLPNSVFAFTLRTASNWTTPGPVTHPLVIDVQLQMRAG